MSSTVYYDNYHTSSWGPAPSYTTTERQHKYLIDYDEKSHGSSRPSRSVGILKAIRSRLCRVFGSRRLGNHKNSSVDSLAYAKSDDDSNRLMKITWHGEGRPNATPATIGGPRGERVKKSNIYPRVARILPKLHVGFGNNPGFLPFLLCVPCGFPAMQLIALESAETFCIDTSNNVAQITICTFSFQNTDLTFVLHVRLVGVAP
ncbi:uncharacterized protein FOMMEDRAFT_167739 [Fomitiporia mediterranea MF3/22]|uniref:uncharacterized protein n=1 Tax=Fomitiporia mediterranea (strain MF3/22) TaxID=694068 RepID=UPI00044072C6|nr:uncharacterized protein FOMMEDRAFT_167739 [Fomitiporia mediterranea MF3/22]EJD04580.1 hypothetical protein FOMMEDRAFT_167739 [Fomitiporia mediterranea MF3/22]